MDFLLTLQNVAVLFLLIIIGYIVGKVGIITESGQKELSGFVLKVTMPATIILAFQIEFTRQRFNTALRIMVIVSLAYVFMILLSKFVSRFYKVNKKQKDVIEIGSILSNVSFIGFPIILSILGKEALFFAVLGSSLIFEVVSWTYATYIIGRNAGIDFKENLFKKIFLNPGILSTMIGFILFILSIIIPEPLNSTMELLNQATPPLAMIVVGILLSRSNIKKTLTSGRLYIVALFKLIIFPLLIFFILKIFGFTGMEIIIPVITLSMPTAAYVAIFASDLGNDVNLASQIVFISSLLSVITIPIIIFIIL